MDIDAISGLLFDKDGTLIDFRDTWDAWAGDLIVTLSDGDQEKIASLATSMRYNFETQSFLADSPIIAGTAHEAAECVARGLPGRNVNELEDIIADAAAKATMAPVVPLAPLLKGFSASGLKLGVATNDAEDVARSNLCSLGVQDAFDFIAGFDSGYGGKPDPGMVLAFCNEMGLPPKRCAMVGDSRHDLLAARRAGCVSVGVLTGISEATDLKDLADVILPDIGHLPVWLRGDHI
ncbi:MAG: HAD family hydrolase [Marinovum sp.]|nr:HAD family hydrolase [Marinovum sp.]